MDAFKNKTLSMNSPARRAEAVVPNDAADLPNASRAIYIGGPGDIRITTVGGDTVTLVAASGVLSICVARVHDTGTDATDIVSMW